MYIGCPSATMSTVGISIIGMEGFRELDRDSTNLRCDLIGFSVHLLPVHGIGGALYPIWMFDMSVDRHVVNMFNLNV
jgi:hypothetical protein